MKLSLRKIGDLLEGEIEGNPNHIISGIASFEEAKYEDITFADTPKFIKKINLSKAGAIIVPQYYIKNSDINLIKVSIPRFSFIKLIKLFNPKKKKDNKISNKAFIHNTALIHISVHIGPFVYIGEKTVIGENSVLNPGVKISSNVKIGKNVIINSNVTIMDNCIIGNRVIIHSGTVIGSDGFGFVTKEKKHYKIPHIGIVKIDNDVEIGACNTIDRATMGKTWIKSGVKTDNIVHIAHNVCVGKNTLIISNVAIAGSTCIGDNVIIAGKTGIAGHLKIGNNAIIGAKSGVIKNVDEGSIVSGLPAIPHKKWLRIQRIILNLPSIFNKVKNLDKTLQSFKLLLKNKKS